MNKQSSLPYLWQHRTCMVWIPKFHQICTFMMSKYVHHSFSHNLNILPVLFYV